MQNPYADFDFNTTVDDLAVCVDASNEFTSGILGSKYACEVLPWVAWFLKNFKGKKAVTQDTHGPDYLDTEEGKNLPIVHGQPDTFGWQLAQPILDAMDDDCLVFRKDTFGSDKLFEHVRAHHYRNIYVFGYCTGICALACAIMAKTGDPNAHIVILSKLCSCVSKQTHDTALAAMKLLHMEILPYEEPAANKAKTVAVTYADEGVANILRVADFDDGFMDALRDAETAWHADGDADFDAFVLARLKDRGYHVEADEDFESYRSGL